LLLASSVALTFFSAGAFADASDSPSGDIQTVVVTAERAVTATKTDTELVDIPQAIDIIPAQRIADMGVTTLQDSLGYSSGLRSDPYGSDTRGDYTLLRGVEPSIFQDGLRQAFSLSIPSPRTEVYTLSRVEVLLGPSSMLYGQTSAGGLINSLSKLPQFTSAADAQVSYGNFATGDAMFDATGPLGSDSVAGRLIGVWRDEGTQVDHVRSHRLMLNPSITWDIDADTTLTLLGLYQKDHQGLTSQFLPLVGTLYPAPNGPISFHTFMGEPNYDRNDVTESAITGLFQHKFNGNLTFNADFRYTHQDINYGYLYLNVFSDLADPFVDPGNTEIGRYGYAATWGVNTVAADARMQYDVSTGPLEHEFLAGVDYNSFRNTSSIGSDLNTPINVYHPVYGTYDVPTLYAQPAQLQTEFGVYAQDQILIYDRVHLILGARHDSATNSTTGSPDQDDGVWTKRAGLVVDLPYNVSPYVSYSESFQPVVGETFAGTPFDPQRGNQVEGGIKWQPDRETLATLAVYDIDLNHQLETDPSHLLYQIESGSIKSRGVEVSATRTIADDFDVVANYSYDHAVISADAYPIYVGKQVASVPKSTASIWGVKLFSLGDRVTAKLGGGVRYTGDSYDLTNTITTPSYALLDLVASVDWQRSYFSVNVNNVFDKRYLTTCLSYGDCYAGTERTILATFGYRF
jgi:iron complex outermembrane receptor protein